MYYITKVERIEYELIESLALPNDFHLAFVRKDGKVYAHIAWCSSVCQWEINEIEIPAFKYLATHDPSQHPVDVVSKCFRKYNNFEKNGYAVSSVTGNGVTVLWGTNADS